jgi:ubiquinone/menaquinone biosynthesis C-methylase UbiE
MQNKLVGTYINPYSKENLKVVNEIVEGSSIKKGQFVDSNGSKFNIVDEIPLFFEDTKLGDSEKKSQSDYDMVAEEFYDNAVDWLFASYYENEDKVRDGMVDLLNLTPGSRVLEIGCGTGRDSFRIGRRLNKDGVLFLQDISHKMVIKTRQQLEKYRQEHGLPCETHYFVSDGSSLPFPDGYFDAVFHFGGFNEFSQQKESMKEFSRITKLGGKIVIGDEAIPPWLEGTTFADIVCTNNPMFKHKVPLETIPECAREVCVRWVLGSTFYLIDFKIDSGTPPLNLDLPHKGRRGGSLRSRYYGQLEGVSMTAKELAKKSAADKGISLHDWLNEAIQKAAKS